LIHDQRDDQREGKDVREQNALERWMCDVFLFQPEMRI